MLSLELHDHRIAHLASVVPSELAGQQVANTEIVSVAQVSYQEEIKIATSVASFRVANRRR